MISLGFGRFSALRLLWKRSTVTPGEVSCHPVFLLLSLSDFPPSFSLSFSFAPGQSRFSWHALQPVLSQLSQSVRVIVYFPGCLLTRLSDVGELALQ